MVEETLSSNAPAVDVHPTPKGKTQTPGTAQTAVKKDENSRPTGKSGDRRQRLTVHLLIGFFMAALVMIGYAFLGPRVNANAASYSKVNVGGYQQVATPDPRTSVVPAVDSNTVTSDIAVLQAEMGELTRKMHAFQAANGRPDREPGASAASPVIMGGGNQVNNGAANNLEPMQDRLEQMMATMHDMIATMSSLDSTTSGPASQSGGSGHLDHE